MTKHAIVNIGLAVEGRPNLRPEHALAALRAIGGVKALLATVQQSDSEPTLVAELDRPLSAPAAYEVSRQLRQQCIAQWDPRAGGELYGPEAWRWGEFNPAFFLLPDGSRLEPQRAVA